MALAWKVYRIVIEASYILLKASCYVYMLKYELRRMKQNHIFINTIYK